eukprot:1159320-Pelagomonas_calceolata.AAC.16
MPAEPHKKTETGPRYQKTLAAGTAWVESDPEVPMTQFLQSGSLFLIPAPARPLPATNVNVTFSVSPALRTFVSSFAAPAAESPVAASLSALTSDAYACSRLLMPMAPSSTKAGAATSMRRTMMPASGILIMHPSARRSGLRGSLN